MVCRISKYFFILTIAISSICKAAKASSLDTLAAQNQAKRLYERLTGVPPSPTQLIDLSNLLMEGKTEAAAFRAMDEKTTYGFYKLILRNLFNPLSSRSARNDLDLNDFTATIAGLVKNNKNFDRALYDDIIYVGNDNLVVGGVSGSENLIRPDNNEPPAGMIRGLLRLDNTDVRYDDNRHYSDLQKLNDWPERLIEKQQSSVYALTTSGRVSVEDIAGLLTTRQWASEFYLAGTNRRSFRFLMKSFVCRDMEELMDTSLPDIRVRQDVDRSPGGDSRTYLTRCAGCHTGMDAFAGAFAYFDFNNNQINYDRRLQGGNKQFRQSNVFPTGYRLSDNSWVNFWTTGTNAHLGWRTPVGGTEAQVRGDRGAKSLGMVIARTEAFSECMVKQVYRRVCAKEPSRSESQLLTQISRQFEEGFSAYEANSASNPYNMRGLFARVAGVCFGH